MKKLYVWILNENEIRMSWDKTPKGKGWYEIEREPDLEAGEYLELDIETDTIVIKQRVKAQEQLDLESFQLQYPLAKIIELQNKAIQALALDKVLPEEYQNYLSFKEGLSGKQKQ